MEDNIKSYLEKTTQKSLSLVITDNTTSLLSIKTSREFASVRLHKIFLSAGSEVLDELSDYIRGKKERTPLIRSFINSNTHYLKQKPPSKVRIKTKGSYYDLLDIYNSVNMEYFQDKVSAAITWGVRKPKHTAKTRTLGSYAIERKLIRINPVLDSKTVPRYFIEYIVYHEMLHADMVSREAADRGLPHTKAFRRRERLFSHYERAISYEKKRWY